MQTIEMLHQQVPSHTLGTWARSITEMPTPNKLEVWDTHTHMFYIRRCIYPHVYSWKYVHVHSNKVQQVHVVSVHDQIRRAGALQISGGPEQAGLMADSCLRM